MSEDNRRDDRASRVDATVLRPQGSSGSDSGADDATRIMAPRATGADAGATVISGGAYAAAGGQGGARSAPRPRCAPSSATS
ncbi:hypothetical protein [Burkholderia gladioli]|uniref:hypothetical protein n=1 Tax=Burkholderia gladioli TaxID=28095 RepID=UPI001C920446|nr:hypothetical protein [Burkholderia gladioli]